MTTPSAVVTPPARRTALVTGAGKRMGRYIALALAQSGWNVAVHFHRSEADARQTAADCEALGVQSTVLQADLADEAAVRRLVPAAAAALGGLSAVVNNASLFEHDTAETFGHELMERHWRTNTAAPVLLAQALHQHLAQSAAGASAPTAEQRSGPQGVVVNLLDQKLWNMNPDFFSYTLSKAALEAANTMLALALAPRVRVVGVAPGLTLTSHMLSDEKFAELHRQSPLGRSSAPEDVAATVRFALENSSITGTTLLVDGGQHLMRFERDFSLM